MKQLLITIAAMVLVGCVPKQLQKTKAIPIQQAASPTAKAPEISIYVVVQTGNIEAVKQHLASEANANLKNDAGSTHLIEASRKGQKKLLNYLLRMVRM